MITYKEHLPNRVPDFLRVDDSPMDQYLEACGELFDEFSDAIKEQDTYKDYKTVPEARLSLLARRFAFDPPQKLPNEILRGVIRDISGIYTTKGVENSLMWIFRLVGWSSEIEYAWLARPERYDPNIKLNYPSLFERDGLPNDVSQLNSFVFNLGDGYSIGDVNPSYHEDEKFVVDGQLLIGRNTIIPLYGDGSPFDDPIELSSRSIDYDKLDYRNFVYGSVVDTQKGTYLKGHSFFADENNSKDYKVVGEIYNEEEVVKYSASVISTPYIVVKVSNEDYEEFVRPYVDNDGTLYNYTDREKFKIAQTLIGYLLFEFIRPSNVRILMVVAESKEALSLSLSETLTMESVTPEIAGEGLRDVLREQELTEAYVPVPVIGDAGFLIGAPNYLPINAVSPVEQIKIGQSTGWVEFVYNDQTFIYSETTDLTEQKEMYLRTPSSVVVSCNETYVIEGRIAVGETYAPIYNSSTGVIDADRVSVDSQNIDINDIVSIRVVPASGTSSASVDVNVTWKRKSNYTP